MALNIIDDDSYDDDLVAYISDDDNITELNTELDVDDGDLLMYNKAPEMQQFCVVSTLKCSEKHVELKESVNMLEYLKSMLQKEVLNEEEIKDYNMGNPSKECTNKLAFLKMIYEKYLVLPKQNDTPIENQESKQYVDFKLNNSEMISESKKVIPDDWFEGLIKFHRTFNTFKECDSYSDKTVAYYRKYYRKTVDIESQEEKYEVIPFSEYMDLDETDPNVIYKDYGYNELVSPYYPPYNGQWYQFNPDPSLIKNQRTPNEKYNEMNSAYHKNQEEVEVKKKELEAKSKLERKYKKHSNRRLVNKKK